MALAISPSSTSGTSWADWTDEVISAPQGSDLEVSSKDDSHSGELAPRQGYASDLPSIGSATHMLGRCKPCAFFHTKGCMNDKECEFCHLCPPHEKQRRKRLRDRMCEKLGAYSQMNAHGRYMEGQRFGHRRQASGASTVSTQSGCSGWLSHSRQSSGSSGTVSATDNTGMVPYYQFAHAMMPTIMVDSSDFAADTLSSDAALDSMPATSEDKIKANADDIAVPIALAQAVPCPELRNANGNGAVTVAPCDTDTTPITSQLVHCSGATQFTTANPGSIPPGSNVVLVPIPVPMSMDNQCHNAVNIQYAFPGQYPQQFAAMQDSHGQWFVQAAHNSAQPTYSNAVPEW